MCGETFKDATNFTELWTLRRKIKTSLSKKNPGPPKIQLQKHLPPSWLIDDLHGTPEVCWCFTLLIREGNRHEVKQPKVCNATASLPDFCTKLWNYVTASGKCIKDLQDCWAIAWCKSITLWQTTARKTTTTTSSVTGRRQWKQRD